MIVNKYIPNMRVFQQDLLVSNGEAKTEKEEGTSFGQVLKSELQKVNDKQIVSDNTIEGYIKGEKDVHEVMVAGEEAKLSLELAIQIRNKLINVYEEFNRMQV
ncbi:flagellar hook-basal body complex protein FliE [Clostridium tunisiense]|uniref:flagellar hook-basal body complex protein FliE n=1 Tax=Clostridium tunisiense TaxID=219748 RepID=UPI00030FA607|nr:flagellar hook-basal body complex protein FliE [Clostridium tunisiense]